MLRLVVLQELGGLQEARRFAGGRRARHYPPHLGNGVTGQAHNHSGQHIAADPPIPAWQIQQRGTGPIVESPAADIKMAHPLVGDDQLGVVHALNPAQNATAPVADHGDGAEPHPPAHHLDGLILMESIAAAHRQ
ncbi:MAG: hypothetical protein ACK5QQ_01525 [Cyanobacteriota bacterium]